VHAYGWAIPKTHPEITDPNLRAATEYVKITTSGKYNNALPSLHATYKFTPRLIARASVSTGLARPEYTNLVPTEAVNDTARTVALSNPSLKPETATSYDLDLAYYTKSSGAMSVGVFEKDLKNFIFTSGGQTIGNGNDNGFNGQYQGYTILTQKNGGSARVQGIELSLQQQVNFGPDWLRKFGGFANYTHITTRGDYGTGAAQSVAPLAEFVPKTWNVGARFSAGRFRANAILSSVGTYLFTYSTNPALNLYKKSFTSAIISASWVQSRKVEYYVDLYNPFNADQGYFYAIPQHLQGYSVKGMLVSFGVRGRF
jgi:TonB-dependent receptor